MSCAAPVHQLHAQCSALVSIWSHAAQMWAQYIPPAQLSSALHATRLVIPFLRTLNQNLSISGGWIWSFLEVAFQALHFCDCVNSAVECDKCPHIKRWTIKKIRPLTDTSNSTALNSEPVITFYLSFPPFIPWPSFLTKMVSLCRKVGKKKGNQASRS